MKLAVIGVLGALVSCKAVETYKEKSRAAGEQPSAAPVASAAAAPLPDGVHAAPVEAKVADVASGQHVSYQVTDKSGAVSKMGYVILPGEESANWIEVNIESKGQPVGLQMLIDIRDRSTTKNLELKAVRMKMGGTVREFRGAMLQGIKKQTHDALSVMTGLGGLDGLPQEDITVKAGTFKQAYTRSSQFTFAGRSDDAKIWVHPAVPVTGMVRSESKNGTVLELVSFGMTGGKSSF